MNNDKYRFSIHQCQDNIDLPGIGLLYIHSMKEKGDQEIAEFVKKVRDTLGITQPKLAEELNCTKGNVSAWENGRHQPSYTQLRWMSQKAGIPMPHDNIGKILEELGIDPNKLLLTRTGLLKAAVNVPEEDEEQAIKILTTFGEKEHKEEADRK